MDEEDFQRLRRIINSRAGLAFDVDARQLFDRRLSERFARSGARDFSEYIDLAESNFEEMDAIYTALTTKETYFFRQEYQLRAFMDEVLPKVLDSQEDKQRLTIWSAGCSTGEEAYTLAMLLLSSPRLMNWQVRIVGTDLCRQNIIAANRGIYRQNSFRTTDARWIDAYFREQPDGSYQIGDVVKRMCHFSQVNLMNSDELRSVGRVDVAFCRNVIIYFDEKSRVKVTEHLFQRLLPGGYLFLGHSESLLNSATKFTPVHLEGDLAYRRPDLATPSGRPH